MKTNKGITDLEATAASAGALEVLDQVLLLANAALHHPNQRLGFLLAAGHQPRCLAGSRRHELPNIHRDMIPHASKSPPRNLTAKCSKLWRISCSAIKEALRMIKTSQIHYRNEKD